VGITVGSLALPAALPGVSVVICTYNGTDRIERVLEALLHQENAGSFEVLLIDNNSTDGVADKARAYWEAHGKAHAELRIEVERQQGLAFARRRGVVSSRYEVVIFCDDDNLLCQNYINEAARLMGDPRIIAVGGGGVPVFEAPPPPYLLTRLAYLACGDRYLSDVSVGAEHEVVSDAYTVNLFGAGLTSRRDDLDALFSLEAFPFLADRSDARLTGGNDCEICFLLAMTGGLLVYSDRLRFYHILPEERMTAAYFKKLVDDGAEGRKYWHRLGDYRKMLDEGPRTLGPRTMLSALRALLLRRGNRGSLFRIACYLRLHGLLTPLERSAVEMCERARKIRRSAPLEAEPVLINNRNGGYASPRH